MTRLHIATALFFTLLLSACSGPKAPFQEGTHYEVLDHASPSNNKQVVVYISMTCPHCYSFSKLFDGYVASAGDDVQIERIPVLFNQPSWLGFVRLYATMRMLNVHDRFILDAFEAVQKQRLPLHAPSAAIRWLSAKGLDQQMVQTVYHSDQTSQWMDMYSRSEQMYKIKSIPIVVVNGIYQINQKNLSGETDEERVASLTALIEYLHSLESTQS